MFDVCCIGRQTTTWGESRSSMRDFCVLYSKRRKMRSSTWRQQKNERAKKLLKKQNYRQLKTIDGFGGGSRVGASRVVVVVVLMMFVGSSSSSRLSPGKFF